MTEIWQAHPEAGLIEGAISWAISLTRNTKELDQWLKDNRATIYFVRDTDPAGFDRLAAEAKQRRRDFDAAARMRGGKRR